MKNTITTTQDFRKSIEVMDLFDFNKVMVKHGALIADACKTDPRLRQVIKVKLESLKQNCHLKAYYLAMEI